MRSTLLILAVFVAGMLAGIAALRLGWFVR
jgi:hypothetical protein